MLKSGTLHYLLITCILNLIVYVYIFHDKFNDLLNLTLQMTVVEAYVGRKKISPPEDRSQLQNEVSSLLDEGVALNTSGSVFVSKVFPRCVYFSSIFHHLVIFCNAVLTIKYHLKVTTILA